MAQVSQQQQLPVQVAAGTDSVRAWAPTLGLLGLGLVATALMYHGVFAWLWERWSTSDDYSHGFFVPLFALFVLWTQRDALRIAFEGSQSRYTMAIGIGLMMLALAMRLTGVYTRVLTVEGLSLLPFLMGIATLAAGWRVARTATPAILYLAFMVPLPGFLAGQLSGILQTVATQASVVSLQTLGVPTVAEGNIIHLSQGSIGVAEACSGLRMLYAFFALTVGACLVINRSRLEKALVIASAVPIAVAVNCLRITATGLAYEHTDAATAERIFHDLAGWLMMPLGFVMLIAVLAVLHRLIITEDTTCTASSQ